MRAGQTSARAHPPLDRLYPLRFGCASVRALNDLRLSGSGGANRAMDAELKRLVQRALEGPSLPKPQRPDEQNLRFPFDPGIAWVALHYARTPSRVFWDVALLQASRLEPLFEEVGEAVAAAQGGWLRGNLGFSVEVRRVGDFPAGPLQVRGAVKNGIVEGARRRGLVLRLDTRAPDLVFAVQAVPEGLLLSIDLAGQSQHRRGYRTHVTEAPLKETLAAQLLMLARWNPRREVLWDPFCGSGTIPLEAAFMARGAPLRPDATPPAHLLPAFADYAERDRPDLFPGDPPPVIGTDVDLRPLVAARKNRSNAGLDDVVDLFDGDFANLAPADLAKRADQDPARFEQGLVVCNPPYGERLGEDEDELWEMHRALAHWAEQLGPGWRCAFFAGHPGLERAIRAQPRMKKPVSNGPLKGHVLVYGELG